MKLNQFNDKQLSTLLHQSQQWLNLDVQLKKYVSANLHPFFKVVCIEQGELVIYAYHAMAATRLKLLKASLLSQLQQLSWDIQDIRISLHPQQVSVIKAKSFSIPKQVLPQFSQTARKLAHHKALAQALDDLVRHHQG